MRRCCDLLHLVLGEEDRLSADSASHSHPIHRVLQFALSGHRLKLCLDDTSARRNDSIANQRHPCVLLSRESVLVPYSAKRYRLLDDKLHLEASDRFSYIHHWVHDKPDAACLCFFDAQLRSDYDHQRSQHECRLFRPNEKHFGERVVKGYW